MEPDRSHARATAWSLAAAAVGGALILLYPKSADIDAGFHFLKARSAFQHPELFVDVWARPLFQLAFAVPAQGGFLAARLFALLLAIATGWQTYRVAARLGYRSPELAIPLLFLQPIWLVNAFDTMTEPLFALVFVIALRFRLEGRTAGSLAVVSLLTLTRPEGLVMGALWAIWVLRDRRDEGPWLRLVPSLLLLAAGCAAWWLAALLLSGNPLYLLHNWPAIWNPGEVVFNRGPVYWYVVHLPVIVGPLLLVPFVIGAKALARSERDVVLVYIFLSVFLLHTLMWTFGQFGSAGYPRYLVCVAPATALITLVGWHRVVERRSWPDRTAFRLGSAALVLSLVCGVFYLDAQPPTRDAALFAGLARRFQADPKPVTRFVWSQPEAAIHLDRDPIENPVWTSDRAENLRILRSLPDGTLAVWDRWVGERWHFLTTADFHGAGFASLDSAVLAAPAWPSRILSQFKVQDQRVDLMWKPPLSGRLRK